MKSKYVLPKESSARTKPLGFSEACWTEIDLKRLSLKLEGPDLRGEDLWAARAAAMAPRRPMSQALLDEMQSHVVQADFSTQPLPSWLRRVCYLREFMVGVAFAFAVDGVSQVCYSLHDSLG